MEIYSLDYVKDFIASGSGDRKVYNYRNFLLILPIIEYIQKVRLWDARNGNCHAVLGNKIIIIIIF